MGARGSCRYRVKECLTEGMVAFLSAILQEVPQLFTNFYLHRKLSIFLRNNCDCEAVDLLNTRKRYGVIECSDHTRNTYWLASRFFKIKNSIKIFLINCVQEIKV